MLAMAGALSAGVSACGFKAPLYMPGSPQDHQRRQPPPALKPGQVPPETPAQAPSGAATPGTPSTDRSTAPGGDAQRAPVPNLFQ